MFAVTTFAALERPGSVPPARMSTADELFQARKPADLLWEQLEAELVACALSNVYTFGPTSSRRNIRTHPAMPPNSG